MDNKKTIGITLILVGIGLFIISFAFVKGYDNRDGFLGSLGQMEFELRKGEIPKPEVPRPAEAPLPFEDRHSVEKTDVPLTPEGRIIDPWQVEKKNTIKSHIAVPYKYFFAIDISIIFVGIAFLILRRNNAD